MIPEVMATDQTDLWFRTCDDTFANKTFQDGTGDGELGPDFISYDDDDARNVRSVTKSGNKYIEFKFKTSIQCYDVDPEVMTWAAVKAAPGLVVSIKLTAQFTDADDNEGQEDIATYASPAVATKTWAQFFAISGSPVRCINWQAEKHAGIATAGGIDITMPS